MLGEYDKKYKSTNVKYEFKKLGQIIVSRVSVNIQYGHSVMMSEPFRTGSLICE